VRTIEGILLWSAIVLYLLVFLIFLSAIVFKKDGQRELAWRGCVAGFIVHTLTILVRSVDNGHPNELFFILVRRFPALKGVGVVVSPFVLLMLGYGIMGKELGIEPLPPPYQSNWLWVHVGFGWIAYGAYHVAAGVAILYLLKERAIRKSGGEVPRFFRALPEVQTMDELIFKLIVYGFISHIVMLGSGAIWAYGLWGRYWAWDPIETWTLISWLIYGLDIHLMVTYEWKGRRAAWLAIISLTGVLVFFGGIGFARGVHTPLL
jgi:cytochrome c-type biogenesis protein CcsB